MSWKFAVQTLQFRNGLGQQVVVLHRGNRQVDTRHPSDLLGPKSGGVHNMLGGDGALFSDDIPVAVGASAQLDDAVCGG